MVEPGIGRIDHDRVLVDDFRRPTGHARMNTAAVFAFPAPTLPTIARRLGQAAFAFQAEPQTGSSLGPNYLRIRLPENWLIKKVSQTRLNTATDPNRLALTLAGFHANGRRFNPKQVGQ